MRTFLLIIAIVVVIDVLIVWLLGRHAKNTRRKEDGIILFKADFFDAKLHVWRGHFYLGEARNEAYVSNLGWNDFQAGETSDAIVLEFDRNLELWKLEVVA